jgi:hypothetical protein
LEFHNDYLVAVFGSTWWVNEGHFKKKALVKGTILFGVLAAGAVYPPTRRLVLEWEKRHPVLTAGPLMGIAAATASWRGQLRRENVEREAMDIIENLIRTAGGVVTRPSA